MKRLGKYTGTIYSEDYDFRNCPECCLVISEEEANDENFINERKAKNRLNCVMCVASNSPFKPCPASNNPLF